MDLIGGPEPISAEPELVDAPSPLAEAPIETIEPVSLEPEEFDDEGFDPASLDTDDVLEMDADELELADLVEDDGDASAAPAPAEASDDLLDFADLDDIDLGETELEPAEPVADAADEYADDEDPDLDDPDVLGALRFNEGQSALGEERWADAVALLEEAYEGGFDVAELHAMLAYARFQAAGQDEQTAAHAFELLDYAQQMDPSLDLTHAYRGAIHRAQGDIPQAREALDRALELNPYCELAMELLDAIG